MEKRSCVLEVTEQSNLEFIEALKEVLKVRESRCNQYGNSFLSDDFLFLKYQIENKMKRFGLQIERSNNEESLKNVDVALDSAIDAANYAIFAVAKILEIKKNER